MIQNPLMKIIPSPRNREANQELLKLLEILGNLKSEYPPELLQARRAAFIDRVEQRRGLDFLVRRLLTK